MDKIKTACHNEFNPSGSGFKVKFSCILRLQKTLILPEKVDFQSFLNI
jgi:hypothetical protein